LPVWKKLLFAVITCGGFFLLLELGGFSRAGPSALCPK